MRLIDADEFEVFTFDNRGYEFDTPSEAYAQGVEYVLEGIDKADTVDAVAVVRCKDCKYYKESKLLPPNKFCFRLRGKDGEPVGYNFSEDDFCSRGEKK